MSGLDAAARLACLAAAIVALVAVASFRAGRRFGTLEGIRLGRAEALILARESALMSGSCPLCGAGPAGHAAVEERGEALGDPVDCSLARLCRAYPLTGGPA